MLTFNHLSNYQWGFHENCLVLYSPLLKTEFVPSGVAERYIAALLFQLSNSVPYLPLIKKSFIIIMHVYFAATSDDISFVVFCLL